MLKPFITAALRIAVVLAVVIFAARLIGGALEENYVAYLRLEILSATAFSAAPSEVYLLDAERAVSVNLTRTPELVEQDPEWSPDGRFILFDRRETFGYSVCVIAPFENAAPRCLDLPPRLVHLGWETDSETIYVANVDTNQVRTASVITGQYSGDDVAQPYAGDFVYSPDRRFRASTEEFVPSFRVYDTYTESLWTPLESVMLTSLPSFSADGARMAYSAYMTGTTDAELFVIETTDDSIPVRITDAPQSMEYSPAWSPDGGWIVYTSNYGGFGLRGTQLYMMRPDGSETRRLTFDHAAHTAPLWRP